MYTEHDFVIKASSVGELILECRLEGFSFSEQHENLLGQALEEARERDAEMSLPFMNLAAGWDEIQRKYYAVVHNMYNPHNLLDTLYDRLLEKPDDSADAPDEIAGLIDAYIGVIEQKEKISLAEARAKLKKIAADLHNTLCVYAGGDYSDEDIDRLYDVMEQAYFEPIRDLLDGIIVTIAGN